MSQEAKKQSYGESFAQVHKNNNFVIPAQAGGVPFRVNPVI